MSCSFWVSSITSNSLNFLGCYLIGEYLTSSSNLAYSLAYYREKETLFIHEFNEFIVYFSSPVISVVFLSESTLSLSIISISRLQSPWPCYINFSSSTFSFVSSIFFSNSIFYLGLDDYRLCYYIILVLFIF